MRRRPIPQPTVQLGGILELLSPDPGYHDVGAVDVVQAGHVAPKLLELGDGVDVLLSFAPSLLDVLEGGVGRHPAGEVVDGLLHLGRGVGKNVVPVETKFVQERIDVNPRRHGVVVGQFELIVLGGHGQAFNEAGSSVDAAQPSTRVLDPARDHLERQGRTRLEEETQKAGISVSTDSINVVDHEGLKLRSLLQKGGKGPIEK
mmetsp:Transcript_20139/g.57783  ORF Transcript_20139/g.57783 Transcript_20139/m.57783 type:complete len:203 (-) Transcript_20139:1864-2472(-)